MFFFFFLFFFCLIQSQKNVLSPFVVRTRTRPVENQVVAANLLFFVEFSVYARFFSKNNKISLVDRICGQT